MILSISSGKWIFRCWVAGPTTVRLATPANHYDLMRTVLSTSVTADLMRPGRHMTSEVSITGSSAELTEFNFLNAEFLFIQM